MGQPEKYLGTCPVPRCAISRPVPQYLNALELLTRVQLRPTIVQCFPLHLMACGQLGLDLTFPLQRGEQNQNSLHGSILCDAYRVQAAPGNLFPQRRIINRRAKHEIVLQVGT